MGLLRCLTRARNQPNAGTMLATIKRWPPSEVRPQSRKLLGEVFGDVAQ